MLFDLSFLFSQKLILLFTFTVDELPNLFKIRKLSDKLKIVETIHRFLVTEFLKFTEIRYYFPENISRLVVQS